MEEEIVRLYIFLKASLMANNLAFRFD